MNWRIFGLRKIEHKQAEIIMERFKRRKPKKNLTIRITHEEHEHLQYVQKIWEDKQAKKPLSYSALIGSLIQRQFENEQLNDKNFHFLVENHAALEQAAKDLKVSPDAIISALRESEEQAIRRYKNVYKMHAFWCNLQISKLKKHQYLLEVSDDILQQLRQLHQWLTASVS